MKMMDVGDVNRAREMAIHEFVPATDYVTESTGAFNEAQYLRDLALSRSICSDLGHIVIADLLIAAFEIDESIILVRIEPDRNYVSVEMRGV